MQVRLAAAVAGGAGGSTQGEGPLPDAEGVHGEGPWAWSSDAASAPGAWQAAGLGSFLERLQTPAGSLLELQDSDSGPFPNPQPNPDPGTPGPALAAQSFLAALELPEAGGGSRAGVAVAQGDSAGGLGLGFGAAPAVAAPPTPELALAGCAGSRSMGSPSPLSLGEPCMPGTPRAQMRLEAGACAAPPQRTGPGSWTDSMAGEPYAPRGGAGILGNPGTEQRKLKTPRPLMRLETGAGPAPGGKPAGPRARVCRVLTYPTLAAHADRPVAHQLPDVPSSLSSSGGEEAAHAPGSDGGGLVVRQLWDARSSSASSSSSGEAQHPRAPRVEELGEPVLGQRGMAGSSAVGRVAPAGPSLCAAAVQPPAAATAASLGAATATAVGPLAAAGAARPTSADTASRTPAQPDARMATASYAAATSVVPRPKSAARPASADARSVIPATGSSAARARAARPASADAAGAAHRSRRVLHGLLEPRAQLDLSQGAASFECCLVVHSLQSHH